MASVRSAIFCMALLFTAVLANADTMSTWNGGTGNWSNAAQWTPAQVPNNAGTQSYAVNVSNGLVTLDISPTIDTFTLNSGLTTGYDASGNYTTLTVNGNATVNGGIGGPSYFGWFDSLVVGGNLTNAGYMMMGNGLNVAGNMQNSGTLVNYGGIIMGGGFGVEGTLTNTGSISWGDNVNRGAGTYVGGLINQGSIFIGPGTNVYVGPLSGTVDVPKTSTWEIAGSLVGAFANLNTIEGAIDLQNAITLGSPGNTIHNFGSFTLGNSFNGYSLVANVIGNFSNSGNLLIGEEGRFSPDLGPSTLSVSGVFTNEANGTLNVYNPTNFESPSPGSLITQTLINYGTASFQAGTASTAQQLINGGTLNIYGDEAGDIGKLTVGTLTTAGGLLEVWNNGGTLIVGSGPVPSGTTGYYQTANGILYAEGGELDVEGPASLDGTLDIMLGNGSKPIGTVFTLLYGGPITGNFSTVDGLVFDNGLERYILNYNRDPYVGDVTLTVEANTTPEPGSLSLAFLGFAVLLIIAVKAANGTIRESV